MTKSGSSHTAYQTAYTTVKQNMAYDTWQNAWIEMQKISCKSLQKSDWSYGNERQTSPTNHTQFIWLKLWTKEENGVHKVTIIPTPHHTGRVYHSFYIRSSGVWNWGCVLPNWWRYGVWYVVVGYEWLIRTASCRINHTLVRDYAGRTGLNEISGSLVLFFFVTNLTCSQKKE